MGIRSKFSRRAWALRFILGVLLVEGSDFSNGVFANDIKAQYSIIEEYQNCGHIIPRFIEQVMNHKSSICEEQGAFPKPGNCSVFFKCIRSDDVIQPFVEYCSVGYNFVGGVCIPNTNSSDCPQYTCRISDGANDTGNDITSGNDDEHASGSAHFETVSSTTTTQPSTPETSVASENTDESTGIVQDNTSSTETAQVQEVHSEQLQSVQGQALPKNQGSSMHIGYLSLSLLVFTAQYLM